MKIRKMLTGTIMRQPRHGALLVLELAAPGDAVALRQRHARGRDSLLHFLDDAAHVTATG